MSHVRVVLGNRSRSSKKRQLDPPVKLNRHRRRPLAHELLQLAVEGSRPRFMVLVRVPVYAGPAGQALQLAGGTEGLGCGAPAPAGRPEPCLPLAPVRLPVFCPPAPERSAPATLPCRRRSGRNRQRAAHTLGLLTPVPAIPTGVVPGRHWFCCRRQRERGSPPVDRAPVHTGALPGARRCCPVGACAHRPCGRPCFRKRQSAAESTAGAKQWEKRDNNLSNFSFFVFLGLRAAQAASDLPRITGANDAVKQPSLRSPPHSNCALAA